MVNYIDLLSKPYREGERGPDSFDCYGMVREMFLRDWGVLISDYPTHDTPQENISEMLRAAQEDWVRLPYRQGRCAVTFFLGEHVHIGYMIDKYNFIHTIAKHGPGVNSIESVPWKNMVTGFYQWKANLEASSL